MPPGASVTWVGHSTVLIQVDGARLLTDPVLRGHVANLRRVPPLDLAPARDVQAVLVSHAHHDHLDLRSLRHLGRDQRIIVPGGVGSLLLRRGFQRVEQVCVHDQVRVGSVVIRATPADHPGRRLGALSGTAPAVGYLVDGSCRVYFAGDTDLFDEMADLSPGLDLALLPISGWGPRLGRGHLDPLRAGRALALLRPRLAVPIHWGTLVPRCLGSQLRPSEELLDAFRRHARALAPGVQVHVLRPGETLQL